MNILVDENIPLLSVKALREKGHNVLDYRGTSEEGIPDIQVWKKHRKGKDCLFPQIVVLQTIVPNFTME